VSTRGQGWVTLAASAAAVPCAVWFAVELGASRVAALHAYAHALLAAAWIFCVIGGGAVLDILGDDDTSRARLGRWAHLPGAALSLWAAFGGGGASAFAVVAAVQLSMSARYWLRSAAAIPGAGGPHDDIVASSPADQTVSSPRQDAVDKSGRCA